MDSLPKTATATMRTVDVPAAKSIAEDAVTLVADNSDTDAPQQPSRLSSYISANASHDSLATDDMQLMNSFTEETLWEMLDIPGAGESLPAALTIETVHAAVASERYHVLGAPSVKMLTRISGTGLAPWEIHRPQKFVRDLVLRGCFAGRVLDAGCGIGDNALFIAKACPQAHVTAVDVSPRCVAFATAKAGLRRMTHGMVTLETASLTEPVPERQAACISSPAADGAFDVVLDSSTFHCFSDSDRELYVASLRRLIRPGGKLFVNCMSEAETRPGGPRRVAVAELLAVFNRMSGWEVEVIEDSIIELHPTFWGGRAVSRLFTVRKL